MSAANDPGIFEKIQAFLKDTILPVSIESLRLLPDSMILGIALLAGITMTKSMGVFLFTLFEIMLSQRILSMIIGSIAPVGAGENALQPLCQPGFIFPNQMRISLIETIGIPSMFPSPSMFFLSAVLSYMITSMQKFGREIRNCLKFSFHFIYDDFPVFIWVRIIWNSFIIRYFRIYTG
jgi:hypothetical protein